MAQLLNGLCPKRVVPTHDRAGSGRGTRLAYTVEMLNLHGLCTDYR
jgi:hypothetical protein